jgi:hypothetical protein
MLPTSSNQNSFLNENTVISFFNIVKRENPDASFVNSQDRDFASLSLVNQAFRGALSKIYPIINKEMFHKELMHLLNSRDIVQGKNDAIIIHVERLRSKICKLFYHFYGQDLRKGETYFEYDGAGNTLRIKYPNYNYKTPDFISMISFNIIKNSFQFNNCCYTTNDPIKSFHGICAFDDLYPSNHGHFSHPRLINSVILEMIRSYGISCREQLMQSGPAWLICADSQSYSLPTIPKDGTSCLPGLPEKLYELLKKELFTDCMIKCSDGEFQAHRIILSTFSEVFEKLFTVSMQEKHLQQACFPEEEISTLKFVIEYARKGDHFYKDNVLFTQSLQAADADVLNVMAFAHYCEITSLFERCQRYFWENTSPEEWKTLIEDDIILHPKLSCSKFLLAVTNSYRIRGKRALSPAEKEIIKANNLHTCSNLVQDIVVKCNLERGVTLCMSTRPLLFDVHSQTQRYDDTYFKALQWTPEGWKGKVPLFEKFNFTVITTDGLGGNVYERNRNKDMQLFENTQGTLKIEGLNIPPCYQNVVVKCDVKFGNTLGVCSFGSWEAAMPFEWSPEGWKGSVPLQLLFKFVCLRQENGQVVRIWEERLGNREVSEHKAEDLEINDVQFK